MGGETAQTSSSTCWGAGCWSILKLWPAWWAPHVTRRRPAGPEAPPRQLGSRGTLSQLTSAVGSGVGEGARTGASNHRKVQGWGRVPGRKKSGFGGRNPAISSQAAAAPGWLCDLEQSSILSRPFVPSPGKKSFHREGTKPQTAELGPGSNACLCGCCHPPPQTGSCSIWTNPPGRDAPSSAGYQEP